MTIDNAHNARRGFTIIEVTLAVAVFSIVSLAVFAVFRTGSRAYENSTRESTVLQRANYIFDVLESDISTLYYRDETSYNIATRTRLEEYESARLDAERRNDWRDFERLYGPKDKDREDDPNYRGNPFEKGKIIDLNFLGTDGGETDKISFAVHRPNKIGERYRVWGLGRVEYNISGGVLVRSIDVVEVEPRTWDGEIIEREFPPEHHIIAEGVAEFELSYAFWYDNQWYEVENWNSSQRQIRNPSYLLGEYDEEESRTGPGIPSRGTDDWNDYLNDQYNQPLDRVPTYIRVRLALGDPQNPARKTRMTRIFRVPNSQETYTLATNLTEEEREMERDARDNTYEMVFPGALKKE